MEQSRHGAQGSELHKSVFMPSSKRIWNMASKVPVYFTALASPDPRPSKL
ncbi:hypothetical protein SAMD00023353_1600810 [Rosellinia necatrix]|uniref:Uncharacterized protein n=1 Tax=Rosellinia necatrix TaxID=77044 RepID=A0A1S8A793_ROSNE|nr:hypothetical protein SAMD00023353_1600810 [Rosellinia necatrix]